VQQRKEKVSDLIANAYKAEVDLQLKKGFQMTSAEHRNLMAELKRDNGIMAYYHDMFDMARNNLQEAIAIRDNDPAAHYFYGKVMKLVGRTEDDMRLARESFYKATQADKHKQNYGSHLHLALMLARERDFDRKQVASEIDTYVKTYADRKIFRRIIMSSFPPNLDSIYEYMTMYGDPGWQPPDPDLNELERYQMLRMFADAQSADVVSNQGPSEPRPMAASTETKRGESATGRALKTVQAVTAPGVGVSRTATAINAGATGAQMVQKAKTPAAKK
jgi:hypothetical protein